MHLRFFSADQGRAAASHATGKFVSKFIKLELAVSLLLEICRSPEQLSSEALQKKGLIQLAYSSLTDRRLNQVGVLTQSVDAAVVRGHTQSASPVSHG